MIARVTLFFEPLDVLQFRDHRPFDAGYNVTAGTVFPMPSVFLGCLRTALLRDQGARFGAVSFGLTASWAQDLLGTSNSPGTLALRGPLLARRNDRVVEPLFPPPRDIVSTKDGLLVLRPIIPAARRFHGPSGMRCEGEIPWTKERTEKADADRFLTRAGAERYLAAVASDALEFDEIHAVPESKLFEREHRVGIVRSNERLTADERMFYVTRPFRLADRTGFAVDVELPGGPADEAIRALHHRVVPLGGKAHRARIHCVDDPLIPDEIAAGGTSAAETRKLWLITPLVLGAAAWPAGVACTASDRTVPVGGFDMARRAPRPLRQALPAGTVLTIHGLAPRDALAALGGNDKAWEDDRRAGYGVALASKETEQP